MPKPLLTIYDQEEDYAICMAGALREKKYMPFDIQTFTKEEAFTSFIMNYEIELLLIAESVFEEEISKKVKAQIMILQESKAPKNKDYLYIGKYQSVDQIYKQLLQNYRGSDALSINKSIGLNDDFKLLKRIGIYSPVRRCLQTTVSITLGQILANKYSTLYLNFEAFSGMEKSISTSNDIVDLLYFMECTPSKFECKLEGCIEKIGELNYIPAAKSFLDLNTISGEKWIQFMNQLEKLQRFQYVILDLSEGMQGLFDVLRSCNQIYTITKEDSLAKAKMEQYESILHMAKYEDVIHKTTKWNLPKFQHLPMDLNQMTHGELASYLKKQWEANE